MPVFTLLMLTSFLVNAQDKSTAIDNNDIGIDEVGVMSHVFCDDVDEVVVGTATPTLDFQFGGEATTATATIGWQYSKLASGGWSNTFYGPETLTGGTLTPVNLHGAGPYTIDGVEVTFDPDSYIDLEVVGNWDLLRIRRVVAFTTDDDNVEAETASDFVIFEKVGEAFVCDDNVISLGEDTFEAYCEDEATITLEGYEYGVVCVEENGTFTTTVSYSWMYSTDDGTTWAQIGTDVNLTTTITETTTFRRDVWVGELNGEICESNEITISIYGEVPEEDIEGQPFICIAAGATHAVAPYSVDYDEGLYTFDWQVEAAFGTVSDAQFSSATSITWHTETPEGETAWVQVTVRLRDNPDCFVILTKEVEISKEPVATITTPDEEELCLAYGQFDGEGDFVFVGAIELEAVFTTVEKQNGEWTKSCGPDNVIFVVPNIADGYTAPDPFNTDSWIAVTEEEMEGLNTVWAVAVFSLEDMEAECLDMLYQFTWTEYGSGACPDDSDLITVIFTKPFLDFTAEADETALCGSYTILMGTEIPLYCDDFDEICDDYYEFVREIVGVWTVTAYPEGADEDDVHFGSAGTATTTVIVDVYGTYEFTWIVDNGACGVEEASVVVTFDQPFFVNAGDDQEICNNFNPQGTWASAFLEAEVCEDDYRKAGHDECVPYTDYEGLWELVAKPQGANDPTFIDETSATTQILVTSLGTYTFSFTATSGECEETDYVSVTFYPGIEDVAIATNPAEQVCSLAFDVHFSAAYDVANLSGPQNVPYMLKGEFVVERRTGATAWTEYTEWTLENVPDILDPLALTVETDIHAEIDTVVTFRMEHYGEFKITWSSWVANGDGEKITDPNACEEEVSSTIDLYWKPTALILPNDYELQVCGLGEDFPITLQGNNPRGTAVNVGTTANPVWEWQADTYTSMWNKSRVYWSVEVQVEGEWEAAPAGAVTYTVPRTEAYKGRTIYAHANEQGIYRFVYTIENIPGECLDYSYQVVYFLQEPLAGDGDDYEFCGFISESDADCVGWDRTTRYVGQLDATDSNTHLDAIDGYWQIDLGDIIAGSAVVGEKGPIGYLWDEIAWTPAVQVNNTWILHDWIKVDGELVYTINAATGAVVWTGGMQISDNPEAEFEVSRPGIFPFEWVATNPLSDVEEGGCIDDVAEHTVYFKNTPQARNITPIQVDADGIFLGMDEQPFDDCYTCYGPESVFYMLERPIIEQKHGIDADDFHLLSGGFYSTIPATHSVRWYTTGGGQEGPVVEQPIQGGMIMRTYALKQVVVDGETVYKLATAEPLLNHNKHHIVEIRWDDTPLGVIRVEEENTLTECVHVTEFEVNKVDPLVITGDTPVSAFKSEDADGNKYTYTVGYVPGAEYLWEVDGGDILGGWFYGSTTYVEIDDVTTYEAFNTIHVYWQEGPKGYVDVTVPFYCYDEIETFEVDIIGNMIAGQLKYWNQEETYMPTPFKFHPNNIPDYFYVRLYQSEIINGVEQLTALETTRVIANTDDESPFFGARAFFEFDGLDLTKNYRVKVWDGGFSYLEEDLAAPTDQNYLSYTYTWNGWDGVGVTATDALAALRMSIGVANLYDPAAPAFWWTGDVDDEDTPYGFFTHSLADVNSSGNLSIVDIQQLLFRTVGTFAQFANNTPNFRVAARFVETFGQKTFGTGDELTGFTKDEDLALYTDLEFQFIRENNAPYEGNTNPNRLFYVSDIFDLDNSENFMNIYYAAVGDVASRNSTPVGGGVVKMAGADLEYKGQIEASVGDVVTIPVRVSNAADIAAITIGLTYDNNMIEVLEVDYEYANIENEVGRLRVADISTSDVFFGGDETILNVTARILSEMDGEELFTLDPITEFANSRLQVLDITLNTVAVKAEVVTSIGEIGVEQLSLNNYPNPFSTSTTIEYTLPEAGNVTLVVYNRMGQVVATLVNETQEAGRKSVELNSSDLGGGEGIFIYRITVEGSTRTFTGTGNLMLMK